MSRKVRNRLQLVGIYSVIILMFIIIMYPLLWALGMSLNEGSNLYSSSIIPKRPTLAHYKWLFTDSSSLYLKWYQNTLIVATITTLASTFIVTLTAYAFSRYRFVGRKHGIYIFLLLQMFPILMGMVSLYILLNNFGMLDSLLGLSLIYIGGAIPMNAFLVKGYFDTIPRELDESAQIDGAGHFRVFFTIMLPLAKPIIAVVLLFNFMTPFMDFILPSIILRSEENYTLAQGLYNFVNDDFSNDFTRFAAGSILIAIPIATVFLALQKWLISGLTAGSTKG